MWAERRHPTLFLAAVLVATMLAGACTGDEDDDEDPGLPPRDPGQPAFAVVSDVDGNLAVASADGTLTPVTDVAVDWESAFSELDATRAAFVANGRIGVLHADATVETQDCSGCSGLAVTAHGLVTSRADFQPGFGFEIVVFDDDLDEVSRAPAQRVVERPENSDFTGENTATPQLLGATDDGAYVGYLSRNGGARTGPSIVGAYSLDGEPRGWSIEEGLLYDQGLSPDGEHLALMVGGSGGACRTGNRLEVLDTATMTSLGTDPELPQDVVASAGDLGALWFQGHSLSWRDDQVLVTGALHDAGPTGCDDSPDLYQRRYDPVGQTMVDDGPLERAQVGWFGGDCAAGVYLQQLHPEPVISVQDSGGTVTTLDPRWSIVRFAGDPPAECAG